jgi:ABC-type multidrug transport system ATPase subunit
VILTFAHVGAELASGAWLRGLQLRLGSGECAAVHGPRNARATFADLALGLRAPATGAVDVDGEAWNKLSFPARARVRARIGCALDRPGFLSNLDVNENLVLAERLHHHRSTASVLAEAAQLSERLGFGPIPDCRPFTLDVPALHRLAIVRALLGKPELLVFEEVPGSLDEAAVAAVCAELAARREGGAGVLWLAAAALPDGLDVTASLDLQAKGREDAA